MTTKRARVVVTAGASGIGAAIVSRFVEAGAAVHVLDVDRDAIDRIRAVHPGVAASLADVSDFEQVKAYFAEAIATLGGIDVLVNNAGIGGPRGPVEEIDEVKWAQTMSVNLNGMFFCIKQVVPEMKAQGSGCIINIGTTSTRTGLPMRTPYIASKSGVVGFSHTLARELGPFNIRCNVILPGMIDNPRGRMLVQHAADQAGLTFEQVEAKALSGNSMRTWIDPLEVGDLAVFLASEGARHISGQVIGVCGNAEWEG
jgi:NAD(P)-dependent dehydrogenase (short-subunit alcohol dehydrogenase family)